MHFDLLLLNQRIAHQPRTGQGFMVHIHSSDLTVFISRIIINAFACIAARSIKRYFIFSISHIAAAALLLDRAENVEKLADVSFSVQPETEFILVKAARTKRD